jgi:hypothetical protein
VRSTWVWRKLSKVFLVSTFSLRFDGTSRTLMCCGLVREVFRVCVKSWSAGFRN